MKTKPTLQVASLALASSFILHPSAFSQGTAFTYQGRLDSSGAPANGSYDLRFTLHDAAGGGTQQGVALTNAATAVSNGLFTVALDFGNQFPGAERWLEIAARTNGGGAFATLAPRQHVTSAPYAIRAANAGTVPASGVTGTLAPAQLPASVVTNSASGVNLTGTFIGNGAGLTNLPAWQLAGNAGTTSANFVGTTDNQALELRVNNSRALRLEPRPVAPNVIGGSSANFSGPATSGAVIAGGGRSGAGNQGLGDFSAIGGGYQNLAGNESVVGGGASNRADGLRVVVAGGGLNVATNALAVVSGGALNFAGGYASVVAGGGGNDPVFGTGLTNRAFGNWSVISGGRENRALGESATVSGGERNEAIGKQATASGGVGNQSLGDFTTVGGGAFNQADFPAATVSGGQENAALNLQATVGGGVGNYALGAKATIGGGANNLSTAPHTTVPGGQQANPTQYGQLAHAAGMFMNPGDAQHSVFVLRAITDVNQPKANLALDGGVTHLRIEPNHSLTFDILVVARAEPPLTDSAGYHFQGIVKNTGGTATFVGPPTATTLGTDVGLWSASLLLVGDKLVVEVDGGGGGGYPATVRWVGRVDAAEVAW